ncbi:hypothetical protein [Paraurantiacibacter namhicola]|uniref:Uncharacterized protein n=1 Tax=Paraurantiacibacter namhicola TaxID=645517 RepID=A0A1C7D766_9SPHN|nr:hypothetical protein [Paraurantiacibacter namhicola]ANU07143.1 hypothetical protein A6F65_00825 [Paraurantiacibacter namhicola]
MRTALAIGLALTVVATVLVDLGGSALARRGAPAAADIPFQATTTARYALLRQDAGQDEAVITDGLARSPLLPAALTFLAEKFDGERQAQLLASAADLGWRDNAAQQGLYEMALARGDAGMALEHASSPLRRDYAVAENSRRLLDDASKSPALKAALVDALSRSSRWGDRFLAYHGVSLDDGSLQDIFRARQAAGAMPGRQMQIELQTDLVEDSRIGLAYALHRIANGGAVMPGWPGAEKRMHPGPFGWRIPAGFRVDGAGEGSRLVRTRSMDARPASIRTVLPAGRWVLRADGEIVGDWRYAFACGNAFPPAIELLQPRTPLSVPAGCETQTLSLTLGPGARDGTLPVLTFERADGR